MELKLGSLKDVVERFVNQNINATSSKSSAKEPDLGTFPLNDTSSVKLLEEKLLDSGNKIYFVKKLRSYGGSMFQEHTRRILRFLFTNDLAEQYNWLGSGGKQKFSALQISKVIVDAVCEEQSVSRANVEDIIKTWLRHAKERKNYVKKKSE